MKLTKEEKRIKIAEACGYQRSLNKSWTNAIGQRWLKPGHDKSILHFWISLKDLPDYFNDLNAMHEVEKDMQSIIQERYANKLRVIISEIELDDYNENWHPMTASASQRAEAFGLTLNLWTPDS